MMPSRVPDDGKQAHFLFSQSLDLSTCCHCTTVSKLVDRIKDGIYNDDGCCCKKQRNGKNDINKDEEKRKIEMELMKREIEYLNGETEYQAKIIKLQSTLLEVQRRELVKKKARNTPKRVNGELNYLWFTNQTNGKKGKSDVNTSQCKVHPKHIPNSQFRKPFSASIQKTKLDNLAQQRGHDKISKKDGTTQSLSSQNYTKTYKQCNEDYKTECNHKLDEKFELIPKKSTEEGIEFVRQKFYAHKYQQEKVDREENMRKEDNKNNKTGHNPYKFNEKQNENFEVISNSSESIEIVRQTLNAHKYQQKSTDREENMRIVSEKVYVNRWQRCAVVIGDSLIKTVDGKHLASKFTLNYSNNKDRGYATSCYRFDVL